MADQQDQTETKSGGGFAGLVAGGAAGIAAQHYTREKVGNDLVKSALDGSLVKDKKDKALEAALKTEKAAKDGLAQTPVLARSSSAAVEALKQPENVASISEIKFTEHEGKGFSARFIGEKGNVVLHGVNVPKDVKIENKTATVVGEDIKKLTDGGDKSWVAKSVKKVETGIAKDVRATEAFKAAGGVFKQASTGGKAKIIGLPVLAAVVVGATAKSVFSSNHAAKIEADRANTATQEPSRA